MNEIFRPISGHPEYEVSDQGTVVSLKAGKRTPLKGWFDFFGYRVVSFRAKGVTTKHKVHRLVLVAFAGEPSPGQVCRHANANPADNRAENLSWGTMKENSEDMVAHGNSQFGERAPSHKLTEQQALEVLKDPAPYAAIARKYGMNKSSIQSIKCGENWAYLRKKHPDAEVKLQTKNKLDEIAVRVIRTVKCRSKALAYYYGVSSALVRMVRRGQWWRHVNV